MRKSFFLFVIVCCFFLIAVNCALSLSPRLKITGEWDKRNSHLIPGREEMAAVLKLDGDRDGLSAGEDDDIDADGIENLRDNDIDGDGVRNIIDPAPYDWREAGYNPFGVLAFLSWNHEWNNFKYDKKSLEEIIKIIKEAGASYVRMDFYWNDIEPGKGTFNFEKYDFIVQLCSENNIRILGILDYSAGWASDSWNSPPYDDDDFVNYCRIVVSRYKNKVKYWEIWNEPDSRWYWQPQDGMKRYSQLLKKSYKAIKEADPSSKVIVGGLTSEGYYALKNLYREGAGDYFDIVNIHPFVDPLEEAPFNKTRIICGNIRKLMKTYGDENKKIWITEIGCPGTQRAAERENNWWFGRSPDEFQQKDFLEGIYKEVISLEGVEKVFWAFFRDNKEHFNSGVDYFGLIRWDMSRKPAFYSYKKSYLRWRREQFKRNYKK